MCVEALALAVAARVPAVVWGAPGTGKSSAVAAMARRAGLPCEVVIASIREPSDFAGLPIVAGDGVRFAPPQWAVNLSEAGRGVLFLDEISTAPPAVQAALLRVVLERVVGDLILPEQVAIVAAANPVDQAADGWDLSAPLANRFCHLQWSVDPQEVATGLVAGFPDPEPPALEAGWEATIPQAAGMVGAFVTLRPSLLSAPPTDRSAAGQAWPSPRTWEMTARLLAACGAANASMAARRMLVAGAVGEGPGLELLTWLDELDLPDPEALLTDPTTLDLPERGDKRYAVLSSVAAAVAADLSVERWQAGWKVLGMAADQAPDVAAMAARVLARIRPDGVAAPPEAARFVPVLREAGLVP